MNIKYFFQEKILTLTSKWWFYVILLILFFIPSYASNDYSPEETSKLVQAVLSNPILYRYDSLFIIFKILPLTLIVLFVYKPKIGSRIFSFYVSMLMFIVGLFQHMSHTEDYGFTVLIGNLVLVCIVGLVWLWEFIVQKNNFELQNIKRWKLFLIPFSILAYWYPVSSDIRPNFVIQALFTNEAGLTYCMITPTILTILILYFPRVNLIVLRITSFTAFIFAIMNMITWFGINLDMWWMGVVHIPLLITSITGLFLSKIKKSKKIKLANR